MNINYYFRCSVLFLMASFTAVGHSESSLPNLQWVGSADDKAFTVEFSKDRSFESIEFTKTTVSNNISFKSQINGLYYWRVKSITGKVVSAPKPIKLIDYFGDIDNDGLKNGWEMNGHNDIDLPALGTSYRKKDVFVYMDYMKESLLPTSAGFDKIVQVFADGSNTNPDGTTGIKLHLKMGNKIPFDENLDPYWDAILALKNTHFPKKYDPIYHYMIWAHAYNSGTSSGVSLGVPGHDFIVSLGTWGERGDEDAKIGTFLHELGHNLGLMHGGVNHDNWKPNFLSVMNYMFQIKGLVKDNSLIFDYQRIDTNLLDENELIESRGIGPEAVINNYGSFRRCNGKRELLMSIEDGIDWNCDGEVFGVVNYDISGTASTKFQGANDWARINLPGGFTSSVKRKSSAQHNHERELDLKSQLELDKLYQDKGL